MGKFRKPFLALVAAAVMMGAFVFHAPAGAQEISGSLVGSVTDPGGAAIAGTTVKLTNLGTGERSYRCHRRPGELSIAFTPGRRIQVGS